MKVIRTINLDNWKESVICNHCTSRLEVEESDILCKYSDRHTVWLIIKNDRVNFYCVCPICRVPVNVYGIPGAIAERIKDKNPPPPEPKLSWFQRLFDI